MRRVGIAAWWWWGPAHRVGIAGGWRWRGLAFHVGVVPQRSLCMAGWQCLAFCVEVAPQWGLCVVGQHRGGPCVLCWDGITAGLARGKSASWVDLVCSDGVAVAVDLHVVKMEAARLVCSEAEAVAGTCKA